MFCEKHSVAETAWCRMYAEFNIGTNINHKTGVSLLVAKKKKKIESTEYNEKENDAFDQNLEKSP